MNQQHCDYPDVVDADLVGTYPATAFAGGGYVWDEVLEYRVWCQSNEVEDDCYYAFPTYAEALAFSERTEGAEEPLALIRQVEYIDEPEAGEYRHIKEERIAEWPVEFLRRPRRAAHTIPDFLSPDAPANRLDIIRGLAGQSKATVDEDETKSEREGLSVRRLQRRGGGSEHPRGRGSLFGSPQRPNGL